MRNFFHATLLLSVLLFILASVRAQAQPQVRAGEAPVAKTVMLQGRAVPYADVVAAYQKVKTSYVYDKAFTPEPIQKTALLAKWTEAQKLKAAVKKVANRQAVKTRTIHKWGHLARVAKPEIVTLDATVVRRNGIGDWLLSVGGAPILFRTDARLQAGPSGRLQVQAMRKMKAGSKPEPLTMNVMLPGKGKVEAEIYEDMTITPQIFMQFLRNGFAFEGCDSLMPGAAAVTDVAAAKAAAAKQAAQAQALEPPAPVKPGSAVSKPGRATPARERLLK